MLRLFRYPFYCILFTVVIYAGGKELTLPDIWSSQKFMGKSIRGIQWAKDGKSYTYLETDTVTKSTVMMRFDVKSKERKAVVAGSTLKIDANDPPFSFSSYQWSPDEKQILFVSSPPRRQYLSRLTPAGNYFLYDMATKKFSRITDVDVPQYNQKFSPDGKYIGYVRGNNIYRYDIAGKAEQQLTFTGTDQIINGKFDWVYEEEFGIADGWVWSPDGAKIAFWQIDQTRVPEYSMTEWDSTHLTVIPMKYPKPGDKNAIAKIGIITLSTGDIYWIDTGNDDDMYIPRITWTGMKDRLAVQRLNRVQNKLELLLFDVTNGTQKTLLVDESDTWVEIHNDLRFLKNGNFIWSSERDGYNHLYHYASDGKLINQITKGQWEVDAFYGIDEKNNVLFFTSSEVSPVERHIYSVSLDGKRKKQLSLQPGTHSANFSPTFDHYIGYHSNSTQPTRSALMAKDGKEIVSLEEQGIPVLGEYRLPLVHFFTFTTTDGIELYANMMKPVDFDSTKKYPVLVFTYGGPGSQVVKNSWGGANYLWHSMLTQKGYIIVMVDNRGTGARGAAFKKITYRNLGKYEVNDQIEGAKFLASLPYVDKSRIGIWGWSYGGYMASHTILLGAEHFKAAIAVAPVTHWKFYDTIYTERYMDTPANNPDGYFESAPINHADKLKGKFLLIHGTSDDNVHFQNAVNMVTALQKANKQFETMYYPNKNHGISGGNSRLHLYTKMTNFLLEHL
jgi:dipeptidyl-peptidase-4